MNKSIMPVTDETAKEFYLLSTGKHFLRFLFSYSYYALYVLRSWTFGFYVLD